MAHVVNIRNGMTSSDEKALSNIIVAFLNSTGGIVGAGDYLVAAQSTPNNTVQIATGRAYVPTSDGQMVYSTKLDSIATVTIGANSSGNSRIDSIVLYIDLSASPDATASNVAKFFDVQGTPAGSPVAPSNSQILSAIGAGNPYIILANVNVANGFTSINNANITDQRITSFFTTGQTVPVPLYGEFTDQSSAPGSPASGKTRLYSKNGALFTKVPSGGIAEIGSSIAVANGNSGSTPTADWAQGNTQLFTLNSNATFTFANGIGGVHLVLILTQDATGGRTVTWPAAVKWSNGVVPTLSTTGGKVDLVGFIYDGTSYYGFASTTY
jgi:hypothetical protein